MRISLSFILSLCLAFNAHAATQIMSEDFEDVAAGRFSGGYAYIVSDGEGIVSDPDTHSLLYYIKSAHMDCETGGTNCETATGGDVGGFYDTGTNIYLRVYIGPTGGDGTWTEPKILLQNAIPAGTKTFYLKFDARFNSNLGTSQATLECDDLKFLRITQIDTAATPSNNVWHPQLQIQVESTSDPISSGDRLGYYDCGADPVTYSECTCSGYSGVGEWYFGNAETVNNQLLDNDWHTYEIYLDIGDYVSTSPNDAGNEGIIRIREDGSMTHDTSSAPMRCDSHFSTQTVSSLAIVRHFKTGGPATFDGGNIDYDNIELWEGPFTSFDSDDMPILSVPAGQSSGVTISNGSIVY